MQHRASLLLLLLHLVAGLLLLLLLLSLRSAAAARFPEPVDHSPPPGHGSSYVQHTYMVHMMLFSSVSHICMHVMHNEEG